LEKQAATTVQPEEAARQVWPAQAQDQRAEPAAREPAWAQALEKQAAMPAQPEVAARQVWSAQAQE